MSVCIGSGSLQEKVNKLCIYCHLESITQVSTSVYYGLDRVSRVYFISYMLDDSAVRALGARLRKLSNVRKGQ
jgi:hypothetical protein